MSNRRLVKVMASVALAALGLSGCDAGAPVAQQGSPPPPAVIVTEAKVEDISLQRTYTGRVEAIDTVQVRARIPGFLKSRNFTEGAAVKQGDLMFEIEPDSYQIAVGEAEANLESAKAALTLAQQTFDRTAPLAQRNIASGASLDDARAKLAQAKATVLAREADLRKARLDVSYTKILAPISGHAGRAAFSSGAYVDTQSDPLVTVVSQDPMYVSFPVPQIILLDVRKTGRGPDSVIVRLRLADGTMYDQDGTIEFPDVQATSSTDSVIVRAKVPNPKQLLVDKQIIEVVIVGKKPEEKLVIPQGALMLDQQGAHVLSVDDQNKVVLKRITTGDQRGPWLIVEAGLSAGDRVVVSGQQKVRPGQLVSPQQQDRVTSQAQTESRAE